MVAGSRPPRPHVDSINTHRKIADLLEQGDEKAMLELKDKTIVAWTPADPSSLNRIMSQFMRRTSTDSPTSITFIAPLPFSQVLIRSASI